MNLVERITLHLFGILPLFKKKNAIHMEVRISSGLTTDTPAVSTEAETCALKGGQKVEWRNKTLLSHEYC